MSPTDRARVRLSVWAAIACLVLAACGPAQQKPVTAAAELTDIPIAVVGPMSGELAVFGEQVREGAALAVEDINAAGGVNGYPLRLVVGDDQCDPKRAAKIASEMADQGVVFVAGHFCSGSSIRASEIYHGKGIVQISPASSNPALTDEAAQRGWHHVFRICGRDDRQGVVAAGYLVDHYGNGRIAVVRDGSRYANQVAGTLLKSLKERGVATVIEIEIEAGHDSYAAEADELIAGGADAVYYAGYHEEAAVLLRQARAKGFAAPFIGPDSFSTSELWTIAGSSAEGVMFTTLGYPAERPAVQALVKQLAARGHDAQLYTIQGYVAVQVYAEAARRAGSVDAAAVSAALRQGSYDTVIGPVAFDAKGDIVDPLWSWYRFSGGDLVLM